jgi:hypothetical protein
MPRSSSSSMVSSFVSVYSKKNNDNPIKLTKASINIEKKQDNKKNSRSLEITSNSRKPLVEIKQSNNKTSKTSYVEPKMLKKYLNKTMMHNSSKKSKKSKKSKMW